MMTQHFEHAVATDESNAVDAVSALIDVAEAKADNQEPVTTLACRMYTDILYIDFRCFITYSSRSRLYHRNRPPNPKSYHQTKCIWNL